MGELADDRFNGDACEQCGMYFADDGPGYPRLCDDCKVSCPGWPYGKQQDADAALAKCHPKIERGKVWCKQCGNMQKVDPRDCIAHGWPKCCGQTMTIDAMNERTIVVQ